MLRHGPVGCQASRHFQLNVPKLPSLCEPLEHQNSFRFDRLLRTGGFSVSQKSDRHPWLSPVVAMAVPPTVVQTTNPADASSSSKTLGEVVVVGAGPAGCLLAHYLLRRGFFVHLFDKRPVVPSPQHDEDGSDQLYVRGDSRSYPFLLTSRAMKALQGAGLEVPPNLLNKLVGSCTHLSNGKKRKFDYSNESGLVSFGVSRNALVAWLQYTLRERYSNLKTYFEYELKSVDTTNNTASFRLCSKNFFSQKPDSLEVKYDLLVGADGVNSAVRSEMMHLDSTATSSSRKKSKPLEMDFQPSNEEFKSFYLSPKVAKKSLLFEDHDRVQSWPSMNILVSGMADGSFWGGSKNKQLMNTSSAHEVEILLRGSAPELYELLLEENPNFCEDFLKQPAISFGGAIKLSRFHYGDILVIGDAAHAMFPTYGTGCNAALEDCLLLDQILEDIIPVQGDINFNEVGKEFSKRRVEDAHSIVKMNTTQELFPRGFFGILQAMLLTSLHKLAPSIFRPMAYQQLWLDTRFRQIELQKRTEDTLFFGILLLLALLVIAALLFAFGIQPKFKLNPS